MSNIQEAVEFLKGMGRLVFKSSFYQTAPLDMPGDTEDFLNLVLAIDSDFFPGEILKKIMRFEKKLGRKKTKSGYETRTIDIDILLIDDLIIREEKLIIPHPRMHRRAFVLIPLLEISPDIVDPVSKKPFRKILNRLPHNQRVSRISQ